MSTLGNQPINLPPVAAAVDRIQGSIGRLDDRISQLSDRLSPVLDNRPTPLPDCKEQAIASGSPLYNSLDSADDRLNHQINRIVTLIELLDI